MCGDEPWAVQISLYADRPVSPRPTERRPEIGTVLHELLEAHIAADLEAGWGNPETPGNLQSLANVQSVEGPE